MISNKKKIKKSLTMLILFLSILVPTWYFIFYLPTAPIKLIVELCSASSSFNEKENSPCERQTVYIDKKEILYVFNSDYGLMMDFDGNTTYELDFKNNLKWPHKGLPQSTEPENPDAFQKITQKSSDKVLCSSNKELGYCSEYWTQNESGDDVKILTRRPQWHEKMLLFFQNTQESKVTKLISNQDTNAIIFKIQILAPNHSEIKSSTEILATDIQWLPVPVPIFNTYLRPANLKNILSRFTNRPNMPMQVIEELRKLTPKERENYLRSQGVQIIEANSSDKK